MGISGKCGLALIQEDGNLRSRQGYQQRDEKMIESHTDDGDAKNGPDASVEEKEHHCTYSLFKSTELDSTSVFPELNHHLTPERAKTPQYIGMYKAT